MLPAQAGKRAPHTYQPREQQPPAALERDPAAACGRRNAVPAQDLSLPFPLALSEERRVWGGLATPTAGYAEASSSQVLAVCHGTCSSECSGHVKATEEP